MKPPLYLGRMTEVEAAFIRRGLGDLMRNVHRNAAVDEIQTLAIAEIGRRITDAELATLMPEIEACVEECMQAAVVNDRLILDAAALAKQPDAAGRVARAYLELTDPRTKKREKR